MKVAIALVLTLAMSTLGAPLPAAAQPANSGARIGWLGAPARAANDDIIGGFRDELRQRGYVEGRDFVFEFRFADGQVDRLPKLATELVDLRVDAIVVVGSQVAAAARRATASIPIVMVSVGGPVEAGLVASLSRPGGNVTGVSTAHEDIAAKWLELLHELVPRATQFAYVEDPTTPLSPTFFREILGAARKLGVTVRIFPVTRPEDVETQLAAIAEARMQGIVVGATPVPRTKRKEIIAFAGANRIPATYGGEDYVDAGGLMSYNPSRPAMGRQGADFVIRILKGAKPGDLPVQAPMKIELVINMSTAKALGLDVPASFRQRVERFVD